MATPPDEATQPTTANMPAGSRLVALKSIRRDPSLSPRARLDKQRKDELAAIFADEELEAFDPEQLGVPALDVMEGADGELVLVNGAHRLEAAKQAGMDEIPVRMLEVPEDKDAALFAFEQALEEAARSPKPLNRKEKRDAVRRLLVAYPQKGERELARQAGVSHPFVSKLREEMRVETFPPKGQEPASAIDGLAKLESANQVAKKMVDGLDRLWHLRGLGNDEKCTARTGKRIADALRRVHEDPAEAYTRLLVYRGCLDAAIVEVEGELRAAA